MHTSLKTTATCGKLPWSPGMHQGLCIRIIIRLFTIICCMLLLDIWGALIWFLQGGCHPSCEHQTWEPHGAWFWCFAELQIADKASRLDVIKGGGWLPHLHLKSLRCCLVALCMLKLSTCWRPLMIKMEHMLNKNCRKRRLEEHWKYITYGEPFDWHEMSVPRPVNPEEEGSS